MNLNNVFSIGDKIKFVEEKQRYTVIARSDRFLICTKPYNLKKTYMYTIVDLKENIRGTDNYILGRYDYSIPSEAADCIEHLESGETGISMKNRIQLKIDGGS